MTSDDVVVWRAPGRPHPGTDYAGGIVRGLADRGIAHVVVDLLDIGAHAALQDAPAHVVTGGELSILDRAAWGPERLAAFGRLVARAAAGEHRLVGVCFGSQLVAAGVPGEHVVPRHAIRAGLFEVAERGGRTWVSSAFHYEELSPRMLERDDVEATWDLPSGELLGFRFGAAAFGVQFHPDLTPDDMRAVVAASEDLLREHELDPADALASIARLEPRWSPELLDAAVVRPLLG